MYIAATILLMVFSPIDSVNKRLDDNDKNSVKSNDIYCGGDIWCSRSFMDNRI